MRNTRAWGQFLALKPDLTFLVIGGNDITRGVAEWIEVLAEEVVRRTSGEVRVIGVEKRQAPRGISAAEFNRVRNAVNRWLKRHISFTRERYSSMNTSEADVGPDGVHHTPEASERLYSEILATCRQFFGQAEAALLDRAYNEMFAHHENRVDEQNQYSLE